MEATEILKKDLLDIIFENRNQQYGAYRLRRTYPKRLGIALVTTIVIGISAALLVQPMIKERQESILEIKDVVLQNISDLKIPPPLPTPKEEKHAQMKVIKHTAVPIAVAPAVKRTKYTPPVIVADQEVSETEVPSVSKITRVDVVNVGGIVNNDLAIPTLPVSNAPRGAKDLGILQVPDQEKEEEENKIFEKVEIQASVDATQWRRHLQRQLAPYIEEAVYEGMPPGRYTVNVRFLVEKDGRIGQVKALNQPGFGLASGAEQVVKTGPRWIAAEQNGRKVRSYHTQPITFVIMDI